MKKPRKIIRSSELSPEIRLAIQLSESLVKLPPRYAAFRENLQNRLLGWDRECLALLIAAREAGTRKTKTPLGPFSIEYPIPSPDTHTPNIAGHLGREAVKRRVEEAGATRCVGAKLFGVEKPGVSQELEELDGPNIQVLVTRWRAKDGEFKERLSGFLFT